MTRCDKWTFYSKSAVNGVSMDEKLCRHRALNLQPSGYFYFLQPDKKPPSVLNNVGGKLFANVDDSPANCSGVHRNFPRVNAARGFGVLKLHLQPRNTTTSFPSHPPGFSFWWYFLSLYNNFPNRSCHREKNTWNPVSHQEDAQPAHSKSGIHWIAGLVFNLTH